MSWILLVSLLQGIYEHYKSCGLDLDGGMPILNIIIITMVVILHPGILASIKDDKDLFILNVTMKDYQSTKEDQITFIQYKLADEEMTIIGYNPLVTMATCHHMDTFVCEIPDSSEPFWNDTRACGPGAQMIIYGWDRDALPFDFPEETGIAVGKNTPYKYIVVNIHYLPIVKHDYSGNQLIITRKRLKYLAGVVLAGAGAIYLPPKTHTIKTPFSCQYFGRNISIFAAGVHAHSWARVNSMYRVRDGKITLIIKGDPQQTHQAYLLPSPVDIVSGDYLVGQCVYDNDEDRAITMGPTHNDEMCNVVAGYSYEPKDAEQSNMRVPLETCWGDSIPHMSPLIPPDSEVPPKRPTYTNSTHPQGQRLDPDHAMTMSTDQPNQAYQKRTGFHNKVFSTTLIMMIVFGIALLSAAVAGRLIRMKTTRGSGHFSGWFNRADGFERLEQSSDGENELVNNPE